MITFNQQKKLLILDNKSIAYVIYINDLGYLEKVYFGKSLAVMDDFAQIRDGKHFVSSVWDNKLQKQVYFTDGFRADAAMMELSPHGTWDKRFSPIVVNKADGSFENDFRYVSHKIVEGTPQYDQPMPHAHGNNAQTLEILCKDATTELYVTCYITIFADKDVILKSYKIQNNTQDNLTISRAMSLQLDLPTNDYDLVHFGGRWARERDYMSAPLHDGVQEVASNAGTPTHAENPFVLLKQKGATNDHGEVIGFNFVYSGNFRFRAETGKYHTTQITYGIHDEDFLWRLPVGSSFVTPQAVVCYSAEGMDKMSQTMHRFVKENIITYRGEFCYKPVLFNSWEGCYFTFDTNSVISYIDDALKIGTELFVLDDGWFGKRENDFSGLGDWFVNHQKVDLHKIINHCKEVGIKFGIWFEPEMINPDSDLFRAHPEYALGNANSPFLALARNQLHLDYSNPAVVEEIYRQMKAFLDEYPVDYIKWDYNRYVYEHYSAIQGRDGQGEVYHRLILGYYQLFNRLVNDFPNIMFEGCAGGGGRFDLGTLYYAPQIWTSDQSNPAERMFINYNTSIGYPLSTMGAHVNDSPMGTYTTKARLALFGTYGYEMNPNKLTEEQVAELDAVANIYKKYHKDIIQNGTLYHLSSPTESNFMSMQCVSTDKKTSLVLWMSKLVAPDVWRFVKLKGLDPNKKYHNDWDNSVHTGEYYMQVGLNLSLVWFSEFQAYLFLLTEVE